MRMFQRAAAGLRAGAPASLVGPATSLSLLWLLAGCPAPEPCADGSCEPTPPTDLCAPVEDVFGRRCLACHGPEDALDLGSLGPLVGQQATGAHLPLVGPDGSLEASYLWLKLLGTHGSVGGNGAGMPPGSPLEDDALEAVRQWVENGGRCEPGAELPAPEPMVGRPEPVELRRLNRYELDRSVADLLGTSLRPSEGLPVDDSVAGFDTVAEGLTLSTLHLEQLEQATDALAVDFVTRMAPGGPIQQALDPTRMLADNGSALDGAWRLEGNGSLTGTFQVPVAGDHLIEIRAWGEQVPPDPVSMQLFVDGPPVASFDVGNTSWLSFVHTLHLEPGEHTLSIAYLNDVDGPEGDRNLVVEAVQIRLQNPTDPTYRRYEDGLSCDPDELGVDTCLSALLGPLARQAWRRPLEPGELEALVGRLDTLGSTWDLPYGDLVTTGVQTVLLSPHFLFRPELGTADGRLTDHELATRLAAFLWSSLPDAELQERAEAGELHRPDVLEAQTRRMLADERAYALVESFGGQWLWLRRIPDGTPDPARYPEVDATLRQAFSEQAHALAERALLGPEPVSTLLTTGDQWIGPELASFYGFPGVVRDWQLVDLGPEGRTGLLTNAGLLASLSYPSSTNPARRGTWVASQLLCDVPGEPPAGAATAFQPEVGDQSLRERFAAHRSDPSCAACHEILDPLGFSLERYGPAGELREVDDLGHPVDITGRLPDGRTFAGPAELGQLLAEDPWFTLCVAEQATTYALGARTTANTWPYVLDAHQRFVSRGGTFDELVVGIVLSDAFTRMEPAP